MTNEQKKEALLSMYQQARARFGDVPELSAEQVREKQQQGEKLLLIDVRSPEERATSMITGAITAEEFEQRGCDAGDATVVCYCAMGGRSGMYTRQLCDRGLSAYNMPGAVLAWSLAGGELSDETGPTKRVHTHRLPQALLADGYEAVC